MADDHLDAVQFARSFAGSLDRFRELIPPHRSSVREAVMEHMGADPAALSLFTEQFNSREHANLQLALDAVAGEGAASKLIGLPTELQQFAGFSYGGILTGRFQGQVDPVPPEFVNVAIDVDRMLPCVRLGVYLVELDGSRVPALVGVGQELGPRAGLVLDVVACDSTTAERFVTRIRALMHELNIYRGKILSFSYSEWGGFGVTFHALPTIARGDIVLPAEDLEAIEAHTIRVSRHADRLRGAGKHLKRGCSCMAPRGPARRSRSCTCADRWPGGRPCC